MTAREINAAVKAGAHVTAVLAEDTKSGCGRVSVEKARSIFGEATHVQSADTQYKRFYKIVPGSERVEI